MPDSRASLSLCLARLVLVATAFVFSLPVVALAGDIPNAFNLPPGERPVEVRVRFFLSDINEINEASETFEIKGMMALQWKDERHAFDPDVEGVDEKRYQGTFQFLEEYNGWWPQLILANGVGTIPLQSVSLSVRPDGTLLFIQEITAVVESPMSLRRYPLDRQELTAIFEPLAFFASEVRLLTGPAMTDLPERPVHVAGWKLMGLSAAARVEKDDNSDATYTQLVVTVDVAREPGFTIWLVIVPLSMIVLLSTSGFWLHRDSLASRLDMAFIGLLTIVAYQAMVVSSLPQIAYFTLINGFVYVAYITMVACIALNLWISRLDRDGRDPLADRLDDMARWAFPAGFLVLNLLSGLYFLYI